jgi:O-methyltransferase
MARKVMIKAAIHKSFRAFGLDIIHYPPRDQVAPPDFRREENEIIRSVRPWTKTSVERIYALIHAVQYLSMRKLPGTIVECGVWKGGSMAAIAKTLVQMQDFTRDLYLFDTFDGMSEPSDKDVDYSGKAASTVLIEDVGYRCADAPLAEVRTIMYSTGYPKERIHFVQGKVEETIPVDAPSAISLLRLDTDWYASTKHELVHLFPRLAHGGVLVIDDYGHWEGARRACDEYFAENRISILLNRIDYTGRIGLKL